MHVELLDCNAPKAEVGVGSSNGGGRNGRCCRNRGGGSSNAPHWNAPKVRHRGLWYMDRNRTDQEGMHMLPAVVEDKKITALIQDGTCSQGEA